MPKSTRTYTPAQLAVAYLLLAGGWIVGTNWITGYLPNDRQFLAVIEVTKGFVFVVATGLALFVWSRRVQAIALAENDALRASEERYRLVTENTQDVIWMITPGGAVHFVSPSVERLLGYTPAQVERLQLRDFLTPDCHRLATSELAEAASEVAKTGRMRARLLELEMVRADGSTVWTEVNTTNFREGPQERPMILGVTRDISHRRRAKQALAREVARCRALLDVSADAIAVVNTHGQLLDANEVFLRERGYTREMIPTLRIEDWDVRYPPNAIRESVVRAMTAPLVFESVHRRADGSFFNVEGRAQRVDHDGTSMLYVALRDVTDRRELEKRLLRAQRLESVGLIASGIAHDLNNVLTPILLSVGLLEMRYRSAEDAAVLKPIDQAARRGSSIVQQILTFARGADGQRVIVEPEILLKELSNLIRETFPRNIVHRLEVQPGTSRILGDPTQLHQVLLNLTVNARDAMPNGGTLTIDVRDRQIRDDEIRGMPDRRVGNFVCITVADTGTGMTPDVLDHLFEPFFTTKPRGRGTGLGLSTVHGLVRGHGGFVEASTKLGCGSQFRVFIPVADVTAAVVPAVMTKNEPAAGRGEYVLVADDEPAILTVLASVLRRNGYVPLTAADGADALSLAEAEGNKIAAVITDVMMPRCDGVRLATEVKQRRPGLPVIAMSGMLSPTADDDCRQQLRAVGVTTILNKPYNESDLMEALQAALQPPAPDSVGTANMRGDVALVP